MTKDDAVYMDMPIMQWMMRHKEFARRVDIARLAKRIGVSGPGK